MRDVHQLRFAAFMMACFAAAAACSSDDGRAFEGQFEWCTSAVLRKLTLTLRFCRFHQQ